MKNNKQLMFAVSIAMPKNEAYCFGQSMTGDDNFYIYKAGENPNARDAQRRERWVVIRPPRKNEIIKGDHALWAEKSKLVPIS
ncbi:MAG: hypothetical protein ABR936_10340 [Bacteroidota bacterium]|jgi:hypothetical protein